MNPTINELNELERIYPANKEPQIKLDQELLRRIFRSNWRMVIESLVGLGLGYANMFVIGFQAGRFYEQCLKEKTNENPPTS